MPAEKFTEGQEKYYQRVITEAIERLCGVKLLHPALYFATSLSYSKDHCDTFSCSFITPQNKDLLKEIFLRLEKYIDQIGLYQSTGRFTYKLHLDMDFSIDGWGSCAEGSIEFCCDENLLPSGSFKDLYPVDYKEYLKSDKWRLLRNRILIARGFKCEKCTSKKNLQLHHITYERLGVEEDNDLMVLCQKCHEFAHANYTPQ